MFIYCTSVHHALGSSDKWTSLSRAAVGGRFLPRFSPISLPVLVPVTFKCCLWTYVWWRGGVNERHAHKWLDCIADTCEMTTQFHYHTRNLEMQQERQWAHFDIEHVNWVRPCICQEYSSTDRTCTAFTKSQEKFPWQLCHSSAPLNTQWGLNTRIHSSGLCARSLGLALSSQQNIPIFLDALQTLRTWCRQFPSAHSRLNWLLYIHSHSLVLQSKLK